MRETSNIALRATATGMPQDLGGGASLEYLDFIVDGNPLREVLRIGGGVGGYVSLLVTNWPVDHLAKDVSMLLGETSSALADGRVPLYVCAECGDLGCGAITAAIQHTADAVTWCDFGWQTDYDPFVEGESFMEVGPFRFRRDEYEVTVRSATTQQS